jgi:hypothetical protein
MLMRLGQDRLSGVRASGTMHASEWHPILLTILLSLSRLNHWLPWSQTDSEVMQGTAEFQDQIADAFLP